MDWPGYVKVASGRSLSWGKVSCMGDWVRAFVGIFFLLYFFLLLFYDTRLVDGLTYSFPFSLFQLQFFCFYFFQLFMSDIYYYVGAFLILLILVQGGGWCAI